MMAPKISVCIDSFNYGHFLPEAIESVLEQSPPASAHARRLTAAVAANDQTAITVVP